MTPPPAAPKRLEFLDITKGFLVALMVVYHSLNYTSEYRLAFRYFSFLPPSFIFITGFLVSLVYYRRLEAGEPGLTRRMIFRGVRLLVLFLLLNIVAQYVRSPSYGRSIGLEAFFQQWERIFIAGGTRLAVFEILLPIAYLLIVAPLLLRFARWHWACLPGATAAVVAACFVLSAQNEAIANLRFISIGLVGMVAGRLLSEPARLGAAFWISAALLAGYVAFLSEKGYLYALQLGGAVVAFVFFSGASLRLAGRGWLAGQLAFIGQYSLLAYIAQIAALQVLSRFLPRPEPLTPAGAGLFLGAFALMMLALAAARWLRARSPRLDRAYRLVFA
jgi:peptidoglycan/LPS O-acetylase OafA/YrhL